MRTLFPSVAVAILLSACGGGGDDAQGTTPTTTTSTPDTTVPVTEPPAPATTAVATTAPTTAPTTVAPTPVTTEPEPTLGSELAGRWAHYDVVAYESDEIKNLIISFGFNDFTEVDGEIIDEAAFCFSEQRTDQPIRTSLSDAGTQAIRPPTTPVRVDLVDGTLRVRRPATPTPVGIELASPADTPLPTDPDDPRIVDADGDGNPGITVTIEVTDDLRGELYIARREIFAWEALLVGPDLLEGVVTDDSEQLVIGASDPIFNASGSGWVQYPDPAKSPIILKRVDDDWDCDRLAAERDELFPPTPDVDW